MCGLTGIWRLQPADDGPTLQHVIRSLTATLSHRGPDYQDIWVAPGAGLALGHARLAIVDLSPAGQQPMVSASGRYVLVFNGEIYNHLQIRRKLQCAGHAPVWRGHSDSETLLAAFEAWGVETTLRAAVGMFAMALWDAHEQTLVLLRDRFGEKPLYYGWVGEGHQTALVFASELKALHAYPGFAAGVCRQALSQYLRFSYVPAPRTIHPGVYKLEPGCMLSIRGVPPAAAPAQPVRPGQCHGSLSIRRWWSLAEAFDAAAADPIHDEADGLEQLGRVLGRAVNSQSVADVPLGAFLSGGVDSSLIVALMQAQSARPVQTFTIGFDEAGFDESAHARAVARHLGTDHHELRLSSAMAREIIPRLPWMYDEPFADSSQIPTYWVCQAARQQVTVALSGDAGDELFGGYNRHVWAPRIWSHAGRWPAGLRQTVSRLLGLLPAETLNALERPLGMVRPGDKLQKLSATLRDTHSLDDLYHNLVSEWQAPSRLLQTRNGMVPEPASLLADPLPTAVGADDVLKMMYLDSLTYLPGDILCKVDRAAMAVGLETRVPFLDHRVAEVAWRLPRAMRVRDGQGKWALRQLLDQHVPRHLIERPKAGFAMPVGQWLRGPLRDWAESLLCASRLRHEGYFQSEPIRAVWDQHVQGRRDHTARLWTVLMFQAWLEKQSP